MNSPYADALEWAAYWLDLGIRLWVLGLLVSAAATAAFAAVNAIRHPLQPRAEWAAKSERRQP